MRNKNDKVIPPFPAVVAHRTDVTPERTMESMIRAKAFAMEDPSSKYKEAYAALCGPEDPYCIFMARSTDLIKMLSDPLSSRPRKLKSVLASQIILHISEMKGSMSNSLHGAPSVSIAYAKECKRLLFVVKEELSTMCGINYISNNFYSKLEDVIIDLYTALSKWFEVLLYKPATKRPSQT